MAHGKSLRDVFHFDPEGTLTPPGPVGRWVRLAMGVLIAKFVYDWVTVIDSSDFDNPFVLFWVAFSIALVPYVVNIGWGVNLGGRPRYVLIGAWVLGLAAGYLASGTFRNPLAWIVIEITQIYIYGHLGVAFLLSAILATPGCEMRSIPHLYGKLTGNAGQEHYCPGFIGNIDRWEQRRGPGVNPDA